MSQEYDYLVVGAGLYGATFAYEAARRNKRVKVIEKRDHLAGNIYTETQEGINVHKYGAHIFHTNSQELWDYVNQFATFNHFVNAPIANYKGEIYNLPFNMNTFHQLWQVVTPAEAQAKIESQRGDSATQQPRNLEEQALALVGSDIYEKLIKGYTEKQWGMAAQDLPAFIIKRLPVRFTYDNNYFTDRYQGIPEGGYTQIVEKMLDSPLIDVELEVDFFAEKERYLQDFPKIIYTGMIDEFFDYQLGVLAYRSLRFEQETLPGVSNYQGNAVVNYTDRETPFTRIIEHQHFEFGTQPNTIITREYPADWEPGKEAYYPINNDENNQLYRDYARLAQGESQVHFGGRLGRYQYYDMHQVIRAALNFVASEFNEKE